MSWLPTKITCFCCIGTEVQLVGLEDTVTIMMITMRIAMLVEMKIHMVTETKEKLDTETEVMIEVMELGSNMVEKEREIVGTLMNMITIMLSDIHLGKPLPLPYLITGFILLGKVSLLILLVIVRF